MEQSHPKSYDEEEYPLPPKTIEWFHQAIFDHNEKSRDLYEVAIAQGVAVESARLFLPHVDLIDLNKDG